MVVLQRGLCYRAAGQAPLVSPVRITGQAGWSQAAVDCQQLRGCNLDSSRKRHRLLVLQQPQEAVVMMRFEASSSFQLEQERGNRIQSKDHHHHQHLKPFVVV